MKEKYWHDRYGNKIIIEKMEDSYLNNVIKCLMNKGASRIPLFYKGRYKGDWLVIMSKEKKRREKVNVDYYKIY